jgi:hypothetical protein
MPNQDKPLSRPDRSRLTLLLGLSTAAASGACAAPGSRSPSEDTRGTRQTDRGRSSRAPGRDPGGSATGGSDGGGGGGGSY